MKCNNFCTLLILKKFYDFLFLKTFTEHVTIKSLIWLSKSKVVLIVMIICLAFPSSSINSCHAWSDYKFLYFIKLTALENWFYPLNSAVNHCLLVSFSGQWTCYMDNMGTAFYCFYDGLLVWEICFNPLYSFTCWPQGFLNHIYFL
jgi:hypothetical protein